jgi:hypothetical protein
MATKTQGTAHIYGIAGTVSGLTVQSYTTSKSYANADEVVDGTGVVKTVRYSDERTNLTVEGLVPSSFTAAIGSALAFTGNGLAFSGHITQVEERGESKGFMRISVTAVQYEGITSA